MRATLAATLILAAMSSLANDNSFESCSMTTWETLRAIDDFVLGVPLAQAKSKAVLARNVETVYDLAKSDGVETAYFAALVQYKTCAGEVPKPIVAVSAAETAHSECATKSATRTNVLLRIKKSVSIQDAKKQMPAQYHELIELLYRKARESSLTRALADSANASVSCIESVVEEYP